MKRLRAPLSEAKVRQLKAGEEVLLDGAVYAARDMAHQRLCRALDRGASLPFELAGAILYFVGPMPARPGRPIGAAGPTTSARMDPFSPRLVVHGLRAMIGKGYRNEEVRRTLVQHGAAHLSTLGGAGALLGRHIVRAAVIAYADLGTEAVRRLEVVDFPAAVAYDATGGNVYEGTAEAWS